MKMNFITFARHNNNVENLLKGVEVLWNNH